MQNHQISSAEEKNCIDDVSSVRVELVHLRTEAEAEGIYPLSRERDLHYAKRLS